MSGENTSLQMQLGSPTTRIYDRTSKHSGGYTPGRHGTIMNLPDEAARAVLQGAVYDRAVPLAGKTPQLWGYNNGMIYTFKWDNTRAWHGYQVEVKPPSAVLREWLASGTITNAAYNKIVKYRQSGF